MIMSRRKYSLNLRVLFQFQVTIGDMIEVCRRPESQHKPPWIEDEEDRRFVGYHDVSEALESMDISVRKVPPILHLTSDLPGNFTIKMACL